MRECINEDCNWKGMASECATMKHDHSRLLCPQCHEVTEQSVVDILAALGLTGNETASEAWPIIRKNAQILKCDNCPFEDDCPASDEDCSNVLAPLAHIALAEKREEKIRAQYAATESELAAARARIAELEERVGMATSFDVPGGEIYQNFDDEPTWEVLISSNGPVNTGRICHDGVVRCWRDCVSGECKFPTADAAFAAWKRWREGQQAQEQNPH